MRLQPTRVGDLVLHRMEVVPRAGEHGKFIANWEGPYKIAFQVWHDTNRLETTTGSLYHGPSIATTCGSTTPKSNLLFASSNYAFFLCKKEIQSPQRQISQPFDVPHYLEHDLRAGRYTFSPSGGQEFLSTAFGRSLHS